MINKITFLSCIYQQFSAGDSKSVPKPPEIPCMDFNPLFTAYLDPENDMNNGDKI